mmetsp:Transcript_9801/g.27928  ORF Transcript_9801/g.27928 Transcript_9801/m.27928 type:complete len:400 (+) Transcript_9801:961-2160(+)
MVLPRAGGLAGPLPLPGGVLGRHEVAGALQPLEDPLGPHQGEGGRAGSPPQRQGGRRRRLRLLLLLGLPTRLVVPKLLEPPRRVVHGVHVDEDGQALVRADREFQLVSDVDLVSVHQARAPVDPLEELLDQVLVHVVHHLSVQADQVVAVVLRGADHHVEALQVKEGQGERVQGQVGDVRPRHDDLVASVLEGVRKRGGDPLPQPPFHLGPDRNLLPRGLREGLQPLFHLRHLLLLRAHEDHACRRLHRLLHHVLAHLLVAFARLPIPYRSGEPRLHLPWHRQPAEQHDCRPVQHLAVQVRHTPVPHKDKTRKQEAEAEAEAVLRGPSPLRRPVSRVLRRRLKTKTRLRMSCSSVVGCSRCCAEVYGRDHSFERGRQSASACEALPLSVDPSLASSADD